MEDSLFEHFVPF